MKHEQHYILNLILILFIGIGSHSEITAQEMDYQEEVITLRSAVLKEERKVTLFYPTDTTKETVALYVLDGNWNHDLVKGTVAHWVRWGLSSNIVVVSIDNMGSRTRDLTPSPDEERYPGSGYAEPFLNFVAKELKAEVEGRFPNIASDILFGHSFGGLFTLYTLKEMPQLFDGYMAVSPSVWWKNKYMYGSYNFEKTKEKPFVYSTAGTNDRANTAANQEYVDWLNKNHGAQIELYSTTFEDEDHFSNVPISLHHGLTNFFPREKWATLAMDTFNSKGLEATQHLVDSLGTVYGMRYDIPDEVLLSKSVELYRGGDFNTSVDLLKWLKEELPDQYQPYYYLGSFHEKEFPLQSLDFFQRALQTGDMPKRMKTVIQRKIDLLDPTAKFELNSDAVETSIAFSPDEKTAYVSAHSGSWGSRENPPSKIYEYSYKNGQWQKVGLSPFSTSKEDESDSDIFISSDGLEAYFVSTRKYKGKTDGNPDIWRSLNKNGKWSNPEPLNLINSKGYEASPVTDGEGNLYFSSIRKEGSGMGDFYVAQRNEDGYFQSPILLPGEINSEKGEWNLLVEPNRKWIIFESSGRPEALSSYGDLYISIQKNGRWSKALPLTGINSTGSDLNPRLLKQSEKLIFISSKTFNSTATDIYTFDSILLSDYNIKD